MFKPLLLSLLAAVCLLGSQAAASSAPFQGQSTIWLPDSQLREQAQLLGHLQARQQALTQATQSLQTQFSGVQALPQAELQLLVQSLAALEQSEHQPLVQGERFGLTVSHSLHIDPSQAPKQWQRLEADPELHQHYQVLVTANQSLQAKLHTASQQNLSPADLQSFQSEFREQQHFEQALKAYQAGKLKQALHLLNNEIESAALFFDARLLRARIHSEQAQWQQALHDYQLALKRRPSESWLPLRIAAIQTELGQYQEAQTLYAQYLAAHPRSAVLFRQRADWHLRQQQTQQALEDYTQALWLDPAHPETYLVRGKVYQSLKQYPAAEKDFQQSLRLAPAHLPVRYALAELYSQTEQIPAAIGILQAVLAQQPGEPLASAQLGKLYYAQAQWEQAREMYEQALPGWQGELELYTQLGDIYMRKNRPLAAIDVYSLALQHPLDAEQKKHFHTQRVTLRLQHEQAEAALQDLEVLLTLEPKEPRWFYLQGVAYQQLERYTDASSSLFRALEINPNYGQAHLLRGNLLFFKLDRRLEGERHLREACQLEGDTRACSIVSPS